MEEKVFNKVMGNMNYVIKNCQEIDGAYHRNEINHRHLMKARSLQGDMDKILMKELYHIIGMGDLTIEQNNKFTKVVERLSCYRPVVKTVASRQRARDVADSCVKQGKYKSMLAGVVFGEAEAS